MFYIYIYIYVIPFQLISLLIIIVLERWYLHKWFNDTNKKFIYNRQKTSKQNLSFGQQLQLFMDTLYISGFSLFPNLLSILSVSVIFYCRKRLHQIEFTSFKYSFQCSWIYFVCLRCCMIQLIWFCFVWFYSILTNVGYLMSNPVYT